MTFPRYEAHKFESKLMSQSNTKMEKQTVERLKSSVRGPCRSSPNSHPYITFLLSLYGVEVGNEHCEDHQRLRSS